MKYVLVFLLLLSTSHAQEKKFYFYRPENTFGSDAQFSPLSLWVNGSFDILRNGGHTKVLSDLPWKEGFTNVWANMRDPIGRIKQFGPSEFFHQEIFNFALDANNAEFVPNTTDHVIGGGMQYAKLSEYFEYRNVEYPRLLAGISTVAYQIINEVVENDRDMSVNVDMIADVYIFNTLGFIVYSFDWGKQFFSEMVPVYDWMPQPLYEPITGRLQNAGQQYFVRRGFSWSGDFSFMMYWGVHGMAGLSYRVRDDERISWTFGQVVSKLQEGRERGFRKLNPNLDMASGIFYDKNNSLLASLILTGPGLYNAQLNVYPGLFHIGSFTPGIFLGVGEVDKLIVGITFTSIPVGFGYGTRE